MIWAIVPAAGSGSRFGGGVPKQYQMLAGRALIARTLERLLDHPRVAAVMVALADADEHWRHVPMDFAKPVQTCIGGADRAASVRAALQALPDDVADDDIVLVHDAARPCLHRADLDRLLHEAATAPAGALLAAPVRDTLKRADVQGAVAATVSRESLWRALTPQAFRRGLLRDALDQAALAGVVVTDESMAVERLRLQPRLVAGREDNIKVTVAEDLALAALILARQHAEANP